MSAAGNARRTPASRGGGDRSDAAAGNARRVGPVELTEPEMAAWGELLGAAAAGWSGFVTLRGPLGAGKTALVQAACRGAGVREAVTSPTYALVHRYRGNGSFVHHVDLYRLEEPAELVDIGWEELLSADGPVFVEWPERAGGWLPPDRWDVRLSMGSDPRTRRAEAEARGHAPPLPPPRPGSSPAGSPAGVREA